MPDLGKAVGHVSNLDSIQTVDYSLPIQNQDISPSLMKAAEKTQDFAPVQAKKINLYVMPVKNAISPNSTPSIDSNYLAFKAIDLVLRTMSLFYKNAPKKTENHSLASDIKHKEIPSSSFSSHLFKILTPTKPQEATQTQIANLRVDFDKDKQKLAKFSSSNKQLIKKTENKLQQFEKTGATLKDFNQINRDFTAAKANLLVDNWKFLTAGKAKRVWVNLTAEHDVSVMYTATSTSKIKEIESELQTAQKIRTNLYQVQVKSFFNTIDGPKSDHLTYQFIENFIANDSSQLALKLNHYKDRLQDFATEMKTDQETAEKILTAFFPKNQPSAPIIQKLQEAGQNLALNMTQMKQGDRINGEYTVQAEKASGDLDQMTANGRLTYPTNIRLGSQLFAGINDLHQAGYVHGDLKLENVLIYEDKTSNTVKSIKLSDFGKSILMNPTQSKLHTGNLKFSAPEGRISQQAEVYSTAIMFIRMLEEEVLPKSEGQEPILLSVDKENIQSDTQVHDNHRGVERYLIKHKAFSTNAEEGNTKVRLKLGGKHILAKIFNRSNSTQLKNAQKSMHAYIDQLINRLMDTHQADAEQLKAIGNLLHDMTNGNPTERPTMAEVVDRYNKLIK